MSGIGIPGQEINYLSFLLRVHELLSQVLQINIEETSATKQKETNPLILSELLVRVFCFFM
jgi:hypothetical protein